MSSPTRRNFLKDLSLGTAAFSAAAGPENPAQVAGQPPPAAAAPQASTPAGIMAIAAHPGDAFFAMGAPVALQVQRGARGIFVSLSLGEKGSSTIDPARYGALQREAAERAAHRLGALSVVLPYADGEVPASDEAKFAVCDLIRQHQPGVVVTHWSGSWHKDHQACFRIVNDALFYAGLPSIARSQPAHAVGKLFFADNWEDADGFKADTYLDITPAFQAWSEACAVFPMWRGETGFRYNDYYKSLAKARGCLGGVDYAVALMSPPEQLTRRVQAL
ncbi:MAG TPA: PIG-L family deacetylase [Terriglobia bacterium]|nr:PIG-L family deacetylase [Terriglobia bacterium]